MGRQGAASIAKLPLIAICERRRLVAGRAEELPEMNESLSAKLCHFGRAVVELDFYDPRVLRRDLDDSQEVAGSLFWT